MATINYDDKEAISVNPTIPNKNKVVDSDMNLIKQVGNQILTTMGVYTDDWSSATTYAVGDIAIYDNRIFKNLTGINTATTPDQDTTNWEETTLASMSGGGGAEIPIQSTAPVNPQEDDLWIDTSDYPTEYQDIYSTSEVKTNKIWFDGKPIYRKVYNVALGVANTPITTSLGDISSTLNQIIYMSGIATNVFNGNNGNVFILPSYRLTASVGIELFATNSTFTIQTESDRTGYSAYVIVEYTKKTD